MDQSTKIQSIPPADQYISLVLIFRFFRCRLVVTDSLMNVEPTDCACLMYVTQLTVYASLISGGSAHPV